MVAIQASSGLLPLMGLTLLRAVWLLRANARSGPGQREWPACPCAIQQGSFGVRRVSWKVSNGGKWFQYNSSCADVVEMNKKRPFSWACGSESVNPI